MKRIKKYFSFWELPAWEKHGIIVSKISIHNKKEVLTLRVDNRVFIIKRPKGYGWDKVEQGNKIVVTQVMQRPKHAVLILHEINK